MDARERWQALQAQLTIARARLEEGQRAAALEAVETALAIDPDYLAAHALRDRIRSMAPVPQEPIVSPALPKPASVTASAVAPPLAASSPTTFVSTERYASFEQRAKRRRVDRRLDAARAAMARGRMREAEAALEEVLELDPNVPELPELMAKFDALRNDGSSFKSGRWIAAISAFVLVVIGAASMQKVGGIAPRSAIATPPPDAPSVAKSPASVKIETAEVYPVTTLGVTSPPIVPSEAGRPPSMAVPTAMQAESDVVPATRGREPIERAVDSRPSFVTTPAAVPASVSGVPEPISPPVTPPSAPPVRSAVASAPADTVVAAVLPPPAPQPPPAPLPQPAAAPPSAAAVSSAVVNASDEALVKQVLQRYRSAYEGLDARSARAVWPAVNETALARAFDGLESQSLTFENCNVSLHGQAAAAICRGSARYVPKVGSHEPRVEPRTWNFTLKKNGADWTIESARAQRD